MRSPGARASPLRAFRVCLNHLCALLVCLPLRGKSPDCLVAVVSLLLEKVLGIYNELN